MMSLFRVSPAKSLTFSSLLLILFICFLSQAQAAQVMLAWDANNPTPDGYSMFQRIAGNTYNYSSPVWSGTATSCTLTNLADNTTYYYVVRAFDGTDISGDSNEVSVTTTAASYTINATAGSNGTISPSGSRSVSAGGSQSYTITPNSGYRIASVLVDGTSVGAVTSYTFTAVSANHTISASFILNSATSYTITASAGSNGTISPLGNRTVAAGGSQSYTITPNTGYRIANVLIDGTSVGAVTTYTFSAVKANHTIQANFIAIFTITSSAGSNGTISPLGTRTLSVGMSQSYTITPNTGYRVASVVVDGTSVGAVTSYTFSAVKANHKIAATFIANTSSYTITSSASSNGTISPLGTRSVTSGGSQSYKITPNTGYRIANVMIDGTSVGAVTTYTFSAVKANHTIQANFIAVFTITSSAGSNGTISPLGARTLSVGMSQSYTITPNTGYRIANVLVDGASAGAVSSYTFSAVKANHTISASFTGLTTLSASALTSRSSTTLPPIADAGPDQSVEEGASVILSGLNSMDKDDGIASYQWRQIQGPEVKLDNATTAEAIFTAPGVTEAGVSLTFELTIADSSGATAVDTCIVNITRANGAPAADAGPDQTVMAGDLVGLSAAGSSDPDNGIETYQWVQIQGPSVTLSNAAAAELSFSAPMAGAEGASLIFELTVTDKGGLRSSDTCMVTVEKENVQPVASAGADQQVKEGTETTLDGSASMDPDDGIVSYVWKQIEGEPVILSDAGSIKPVFTAPKVKAAGKTLTFQLTVTDKGGLQSVDRCQVFVRNRR